MRTTAFRFTAEENRKRERLARELDDALDELQGEIESFNRETIERLMPVRRALSRFAAARIAAAQWAEVVEDRGDSAWFDAEPASEADEEQLALAKEWIDAVGLVWSKLDACDLDPTWVDEREAELVLEPPADDDLVEGRLLRELPAAFDGEG